MSPANKTPKAKTSAPKQKEKPVLSLIWKPARASARRSTAVINLVVVQILKLQTRRPLILQRLSIRVLVAGVPVPLVATEVKKPKAKAPKPEVKKRLFHQKKS